MFRVWSIELEAFLAEEECFINGGGQLFFEDIMEGGLVKASENLYKIDRFTGMYDIYGRKIYENDLVKLHYTHENIVSDTHVVSYGGKWLLGEFGELSDLYFDNKKWGDTSKVIIVGHNHKNGKG